MTDIKRIHQSKLLSIIGITIGYLIIQAVLLIILRALPWPVVGRESWGGHARGRFTPDPVWAFFFFQLAVGAFLPIRGKAFLLAQYIVFVLAFLLLAEVEGNERYGHAAVSSTTYTVYWFQFCAIAFAFMARRFRKSKSRPWYPLAAYLGIQTVIVWGIAEIRSSLGWDPGKWLLLAFVIQCVGLLLVSAHVRILIAAEILLGVMLANLPHWAPVSGNGVGGLLFETIWVTYFLQCAGVMWWFISLKKLRPEADDRALEIRPHDDGLPTESERCSEPK